MKKKNVLLLVPLLLLIGLGVIRLSSADIALKTQATVSIEGTDLDDSYTRLALISAPNTLSNVFAEGSHPGQFSFTNNYGIDNLGFPVVGDDIRQYPIYIGTTGYFADSPKIDPWDQVTWMKVDNGTELSATDHPTYNISMEYSHFGDLNPGELTYFRLDLINMMYIQMNLIVNQPGLHILYFDYDDMDSVISLISPSENPVSYSVQSLPDVFPGGEPYRKMLVFTADEKGPYQLIFVPDSRDIALELQEIDTTSKISIGSYVSYKSEDYGDINPGSLQSEDNLPVQSYAIEVEENQILSYNFDFIWGQSSSAFIKLAIPTPDGYDIYSVHADGKDHAQFIAFSGTAYLEVIYRDFYYWSGSTPVRELCYYNFNIETITPKDYVFGSTELLEIGGNPPVNVWRIQVNESISAFLNVSVIAGSPDYTLDSDPSNSIFYVDVNGQAQTLPELFEFNDAHYYYLDPGDYFIFFTHSATTVNNEYIELQSGFGNYFTTLEHKNLTHENLIFTINEKSRFSSDYMASEDGIGGYVTPFVANITYDDPFMLGVNLSVVRADNSDFENYPVRMRFRWAYAQQSKYDGSTYSVQNSGVTSNILLDTDEEETLGIYQNFFEASSLFFSGSGRGIFAVWPYALEIDLGSGFVSYNNSLDLRIATFSNKEINNIHQISEISEVNRQIGPGLDYDTVYYTTISSINLTETSGILLDVNASRMYDWYQFILKTNISNSGSIWVSLIYDNIWTTLNGPTTANVDTVISGSNEGNQSIELGVAPKTFRIFIQILDPGTEIILYRFRLSHYNITLLNSPSYTSEYKVPLPKWVLPAGIGGGVVVVAGIVVVVIKKRKKF
ncbi:MAG: hypothetical protein ACTSX0_00575 [Promethearchaeota archaeon]